MGQLPGHQEIDELVGGGARPARHLASINDADPISMSPGEAEVYGIGRVASRAVGAKEPPLEPSHLE